MSTRSHIIVEVPEENSTDYVYHHCDGYLDGVGAELKDFIKNEYKPATFTGEEFCSQLENWDDSYEYENSGPHGDEEFIYYINIDKENNTISISAEEETAAETFTGDWCFGWKTCENFSETISLAPEQKVSYDGMFAAIDAIYEKSYSNGEYTHKQSFSWGFQEGVDWIKKQLRLNYEHND